MPFVSFQGVLHGISSATPKPHLPHVLCQFFLIVWCLFLVGIFFFQFFEKLSLFSREGLFKVFPQVRNDILDIFSFKVVSLCIQLNCSC